LPKQDGYQLMQQIRSWESEEALEATPAIALTAFASRDDRRQAREAGYNEHLAKPVTPSKLKALIARLLAEKRGGGEP
jgi:CheY-like chemotaxis protein